MYSYSIDFWYYEFFTLKILVRIVIVNLSLQEEFQLALFKNRKKENLFANRVLYNILFFKLIAW